jgi:putative colanic acid biosynthesis glycosyltransferase
MTLFSIITICKDNLGELKNTSSSIKSQSFSDYEWIVVDGDSKDGTKEWLQSNSKSIKYISEPDRGIYDAMNKGIYMAKGNYLIFMNSGDEFYNNNVLFKVNENIVKSKSNPVIYYGDSIDIAEDGTEFYRKAKKQSSIKYGMITQHQAMFFHRDYVPKNAYSEKFKLSADYGLIAQVLLNNPPDKTIRLKFPICKFKMGGVNESKRFNALKEDYLIRKEVMGLSTMEASYLYLLHYLHALLKQSFKKTRFLRHSEANKKAQSA